MTENELDSKFSRKEKRGLCGSLLLSRWTPLSPDNNIQILKTDLHAFPSRISRENLIEEESIFPLVTMFYLFSQFYLLMMSCCCPEKINVGPLLGLWGSRDLSNLPSPNWRQSLPAQVCKKSTSVDVRRSKFTNIPENFPFLKMTSWKHLRSALIMTSSIVPLNILCRISEKFYITFEQLGSPWGTGPAARAPRRVCWQAKFFFIFWPPILQSKTPIRTPTPPLTRRRHFLLLTYFDDFLLYAPLEKVTTSNQLTVKKRNLSFVFITTWNVTTRWAVSTKLLSVFYQINANKWKRKKVFFKRCKGNIIFTFISYLTYAVVPIFSTSLL